jgi:hypothetical protein
MLVFDRGEHRTTLKNTKFMFKSNSNIPPVEEIYIHMKSVLLPMLTFHHVIHVITFTINQNSV